MSRRQRIAVVGAGAAGLSAAISLCSSDVDVVVLERFPRPGGKVQVVELEGRQIDVGPTVVTMRWILDALFAGAGRRLEDYVTLDALDVLARHAWDDGGRLDLYCDEERSAAAISEFAGPKDAAGYRRFVRYARTIFDACEAPFLESDDPAFSQILRTFGVAGLARLTRIDALRSLWSSLGEFFLDPRLKQLFGRYATYHGSSPFQAPATLNLIAEVERRGVYRPRGGTIALTDAMARLAVELGAELRCNAHVERIATTAAGGKRLHLADGSELTVDAVVINADVAAVAGGHFGREVASAVAPVDASRRSLSAFTEALVATTTGFPLVLHNVFFPTAGDYQSEFTDIFVHGRLPAHPVVYVCASDRGEAVVPERERLFKIVNAPPRGDVEEIAESELDQCSQRSFELLQRCGLTVELHSASRQRTTPQDFERRFPGTGGALYGAATHSFRAPLQRASVKSRMPGLYLASGSVHPGAGVPMAVQSGRLAARRLLRDLGLTPVRRPTATLGGTSSL